MMLLGSFDVGSFLRVETDSGQARLGDTGAEYRSGSKGFRWYLFFPIGLVRPPPF